ncbi:ATP-binding protein [archaeon]|nr:ATP-binding protein [archaeon]
MAEEDKQSIIGRSEEDIAKYGVKGTAYIGKVVLSAGEHPVLGRQVLMDVAKPHVILICGKRGGGKSYSLGILIEEFSRLPMEVRQRISVIVIDTVGIFWTMKVPNRQSQQELFDWGLEPKAIDLKVLVPQGRLDFYQRQGLPVDGGFTIKASELEILEWLALFKLTWKDPEGILLTRILEKVNETFGSLYGLDEMISAAQKDEETEKVIRDALANRLEVAKSWGLFAKEGMKMADIAQAGKITVIDVSVYRQAVGMEGTREIIVGLVGKKLFEERMLQRKVEELAFMQGRSRESELPIIWMLIDEAHMFMPRDRESIALDVLLEWVRVGRQPGLSLVLATQRPERLHPDAISQCDLFISHRMTAQPDIQAVSLLRPSYLHQEFDKYYGEMPRGKGFALALDDNSERLWLLKMRPRISWDGGTTATAFRE